MKIKNANEKRNENQRLPAPNPSFLEIFSLRHTETTITHRKKEGKKSTLSVEI
jgi:hypothetical protein